MPPAPSSPAGTFRVRILGPFAVERDGTPLDMARWQRRIAQLFKLLIVAPEHRRTRHELMGLLWPDATEEAGGANLRLVLYRLRNVLQEDALSGQEPSPILFEGGRAALNPAYTWDVDLDRFVQLAQAAGDDVAMLEEAAALCGGQALEDELYEDWAQPHRDRVARQWREIVFRLVMLHRSTGSPECALEWLERVLESDPLDEEALRELLLTLESLNRETEALRRFRQFQQLLSEELDVPPATETLGVAVRVAEHLRETEVEVPAIPGTNKPNVVPVLPSYRLPTSVPLVGRHHEVELVTQMVSVADEDAPRILLLAAEAGMGKTRLLAEAAVRARHAGVLTLAGGCYEQEGRLPYGPIHDALLDYVLTQPEGLIQTQLSGLLPELARIVPEMRLRINTPAPEWGEAPEGHRLRLFSAVAQALVRIADDQSLLVLLDDLHWADEGTLQLLHFLLRQRQLSCVRVIGAHRKEEVSAETPLARWLAELEDDDSLAIQIHSLASLSAADTKALLEERLSGPCSDALSQTLYERSGGNPFFAVQMLRLLDQEGRLERADDGWRLDAAPRAGLDGGTLLPAKVRRTVVRRLSKLSRPEHEALAIGAVLGREFAYPAIEALWQHGQSELFQALEGAVDAYLLAETESGFTFRHPILREVVYDSISHSRRVRLHQSAGEHLRTLYGPPDLSCEPQHAVQLAWHFLEGQQPELALGYTLLAGEQAQAAFAHFRAEQHYRTALDLARQLNNGAAERRALEQLGRCLTSLGDYGQAETMLEQAAAYAVDDDLESQRRVVAQIGHLHVKTGALEEGIIRLTGALQALDSCSPSAGLGALHLALAELFFRTGKYQEQQESADRAVEIAEAAGDRTLLAQARLTRAYSLPWLGSTEEFRHALEEVVTLAEETGDLPTLGRGLCALAGPYTMMGDFGQAQAALARAMEVAERVGDPSRLAFTANTCGWAAYVRGDWDEAEDFFSRSLAIYRELRALPDTMIPLYGLGALQMGRGNWHEGSAALREHMALAHQTGDFRWLHGAQMLLAERDLLTGRPKDALAGLEPVFHLPNLSGIAKAAMQPTLARAYLELGDTDRAMVTAVEAEARTGEEDDREALIEALWVQGMVLARQGRGQEAEARYESALQLLEQTPYRYLKGRVLYASGLVLADQGEPDRARVWLLEALDIFRKLGARPYSERATQALEQLASASIAGRDRI